MHYTLRLSRIEALMVDALKANFIHLQQLESIEACLTSYYLVYPQVKLAHSPDASLISAFEGRSRSVPLSNLSRLVHRYVPC